MNNEIFISFLNDSKSNHIFHRKSEMIEGGEVKIINNHIAGIPVTESRVEFTNISEDEIDLTSLASAFIEVKNHGKRPWFHKNKYLVYYCHNCWLGEGQWRMTDLETLGLYQTYDDHGHYCTIRFASSGSQSTNRYYPLIMIEDTEIGEIHYFEMKSGSNWYMEIGAAYQKDGQEGLYVYMSACCEANDGWHKTLAPKEKYITSAALWGSVKGGFEEAVRELIKYKRKTTLVSFENNLPPVCFNDYMNCCWAMPEANKTIPLIDAAAAVGAEIFCIDAGWQTNLADNSMLIGDWIPSSERFSPYGLEGIVKYVRSKGMKCGVWLEIEGCVKQTQNYNDLNQHLLRRRGKVTGGDRAFYDFRRDVVCRKIEEVFEYLYRIGVRYIKNDYNQTVGIGCDGADSLSEGLNENTAAFYRFVDKMQNKYPDMIIENCGSGAMRSDAETLSHFHLQSTSDQERYICNPSIICGSLAQMPTEKAGIWAYPYPLRYKDRLNYNKLSEEQEKYADCQETIFNMVNSMLGLVYLSGRIDQADAKNMAIIAEAISVYKSFRKDIPYTYPIYPSGTFKLSDRGIFSVGLQVPEKAVIYLAVWKIADEYVDLSEYADTYIDLGKYGRMVSIEKLYPSLDEYHCEMIKNGVQVKLPQGNSAMFIKVVTE